MSAAEQDINRRSIENWPSGRLLDYAEEHVGDRDLLAVIHEVLTRRGVDVATAAAKRVQALLDRGRDGMAADVSVGVSDEGRAELAAMKARLEQAERRIREAEARAATAERALATEALPSRGGGLLRRVHLAETAPTWLVDAARRAFRLRFHPDRFADPVMKARAEETFKEAEEIFRQIVPNGQ
ncbi:hypothetical protein [Neoroseomonas lacus]|uniref:J domain-containing protein n=1 Tax=Neoroseomonas lacus TaxID=287609 RepID=A0A917NS43_9PROT|nr:hypothetical protein [Neoroseomonas lacus]GGJ24570.1 hypothetical protein GCM10011320_34860 [Neoroseomonas lacus]